MSAKMEGVVAAGQEAVAAAAPMMAAVAGFPEGTQEPCGFMVDGPCFIAYMCPCVAAYQTWSKLVAGAGIEPIKYLLCLCYPNFITMVLYIIYFAATELVFLFFFYIFLITGDVLTALVFAALAWLFFTFYAWLFGYCCIQCSFWKNRRDLGAYLNAPQRTRYACPVDCIFFCCGCSSCMQGKEDLSVRNWIAAGGLVGAPLFAAHRMVGTDASRLMGAGKA